MKWLMLGSLMVGISLAAAAVIAVEDAKDEAIKKDRKQIEGTWRVVSVEINGEKLAEGDVRKLSVVNGSGGTWILHSDEMEISNGISTFDPKKTPKTIDFTRLDRGKANSRYVGIYELGDKTRKLCFAPEGHERPTEFASKLGSDHLLVTFEREKTQ